MMEPRERVELSSHPYQGRILPLNYGGKLVALRRIELRSIRFDVDASLRLELSLVFSTEVWSKGVAVWTKELNVALNIVVVVPVYVMHGDRNGLSLPLVQTTIFTSTTAIFYETRSTSSRTLEVIKQDAMSVWLLALSAMNL